MTAKAPKTSWVVCCDYAFGPFDLTTAYRKCEQANEHDPKRSGIDCQYHHTVITSPTKPVTGYER